MERFNVYCLTVSALKVVVNNRLWVVIVCHEVWNLGYKCSND